MVSLMPPWTDLLARQRFIPLFFSNNVLSNLAGCREEYPFFLKGRLLNQLCPVREIANRIKVFAMHFFPVLT